MRYAMKCVACTAALLLVTWLVTGQVAREAPAVGAIVAAVWSIAAAPIERE